MNCAARKYKPRVTVSTHPLKRPEEPTSELLPTEPPFDYEAEVRKLLGDRQDNRGTAGAPGATLSVGHKGRLTARVGSANYEQRRFQWSEQQELRAAHHHSGGDHPTARRGMEHIEGLLATTVTSMGTCDSISPLHSPVASFRLNSVKKVLVDDRPASQRWVGGAQPQVAPHHIAASDPHWHDRTPEEKANRLMGKKN